MNRRGLALAMLVLLVSGPFLPLIPAGASSPPPDPASVVDLPSAIRYAFAPDSSIGKLPGTHVDALRASLDAPLMTAIHERPDLLHELVAASALADTPQAAIALAARLATLAPPTVALPAVDATTLPGLFDQVYQQNGILLTQAQRDALSADVAALAPSVAEALANLLDGAIRARAARDAAYAALPAGELEALLAIAPAADAAARRVLFSETATAEDLALLQDFRTRTAPIDASQLLLATLVLAERATTARAALNAGGFAPITDPGAPEGAECDLPISSQANSGCVLFEDPAGVAVVTGRGLARVRSDSMIQLDLGGMTIRSSGAAGATADRPVAVSLDMGGFDTYSAAGVAFGAGVGGVGVLLDFGAEPDSYHAGDRSQGFSELGSGLLYDAGGADIYTAKSASHGASVGVGFGILVDAGFDEDRYVLDAQVHDAAHDGSTPAGQGSGSLQGVGLLVDSGGDDEYAAWANGAAADSQGAGLAGVGWLVDASGTATFASDDRSQAIASQGVGVLVTGLQAGRGTRAFLAGDQSQAHARDNAVALLTALDVDLVFSDHYQAGSASQAHGASGGVAILYDSRGSDILGAGSASQGYGIAPGAALLANMKDHDGYSNPSAVNDAVTPTGTGVLIDQASSTAAAVAETVKALALQRLEGFQSANLAQRVLKLPMSEEPPLAVTLDGVNFGEADVPLITYYYNTLTGEEREEKLVYTPLTNTRIVRCVEAQFNYQNVPCDGESTSSSSLAWLSDVPPLTPGAIPILGGSGTFWEDPIETGNGWDTGSSLWHLSSRRANASDSTKSFYFGTPSGTYATGGSSPTAARGTLTSPLLPTLPGRIAGQPIILEFYQWHQVEYEPATAVDLLQLQVCREIVEPNRPQCETVGEWNSQKQSHQSSQAHFVPETVNLDKWAGERVRLRFVFDTRDSRNNHYEGWYLDQFIVYQGARDPIRQIEVSQTEWHEVRVDGMPALERLSWYNATYHNGTVRHAVRLEQQISLDAQNAKQFRLDLYRDYDGVTHLYNTEITFLKKDYYTQDRQVRPYVHRAFDVTQGTFTSPVEWQYYSWYIVWQEYRSDRGTQGWNPYEYREEEYVHLVENNVTNTQGTGAQPSGTKLKDENKNGFWFGIKAYSDYWQSGDHRASAHIFVDDPAQMRIHSHTKVGIRILELDQRVKDVSTAISHADDAVTLIEEYIERRTKTVWKTIAGILGGSLKGFLAGWLMDIVQTGDLVGLYISEADTNFGVCLFGHCHDLAYMQVSTTPGFLPFGAPLPVPGHPLDDTDSWNKEFDLFKEVGDTMRRNPAASGPETRFYEDWDENINTWMTTKGTLWHVIRTDKRIPEYTKMLRFGVYGFPTYDTGETESGTVTSDWITLRQERGAALQFDVWAEHETCRAQDNGAGFDVFAAYWYVDGEYKLLKYWSSDDNRKLGQFKYETHSLDLSPYRGQTGRVVFLVNTRDAVNNGYQGWFIDNIRVQEK